MLIKNTKINITWSKTSTFLLNVIEVLLLLPPRENFATAVSGFKTKTYIVCDLHKGKKNRYQRNIFNGLMLAITSLNNKNTRKYEILKN